MRRRGWPSSRGRRGSPHASQSNERRGLARRYDGLDLALYLLLAQEEKEEPRDQRGASDRQEHVGRHRESARFGVVAVAHGVVLLERQRSAQDERVARGCAF